MSAVTTRRLEVVGFRTIDWSSCEAVERDPGRMSGAWVFRGSRLPVSTLFENLEDGASVTDFVEWFQGVTLEQVQAVLEHAARSALAPVQMRVLFDQGTPVPIRRYLPTHQVLTAFEQGWSTLRNGELLSAAENAGIDVLLTTDANLRYQQNLANRAIAIVVFGKARWPRTKPEVARVSAAVDAASPGSYTEVAIP